MPRSGRSSRKRKNKKNQMANEFCIPGHLMKSVNELKMEKFTLICFEYAVVDRGVYYPCEVGVVQFSLFGGIHNAFHTFISPKPLPPGTRAEAKSHEEETHQIPILGSFAYWDANYQGIANKICSMVGSSTSIFTKGDRENMKTTRGCLEYLAERSEGHLPMISVISIEGLIEYLCQQFGIVIYEPDEISTFLERTTHDFDDNIRCFYHERELDSWHCTYGAVFRLYFNLMDFIAEKQNSYVDNKLMKVPVSCISRMPSAERLITTDFGRSMNISNDEGNIFRLQTGNSSREPYVDVGGVDRFSMAGGHVNIAREEPVVNLGRQINQNPTGRVVDIVREGQRVNVERQSNQILNIHVDVAGGGGRTVQVEHQANQTWRPPPINYVKTVMPYQLPADYVPRRICGIPVEPTPGLTFYSSTKK